MATSARWERWKQRAKRTGVIVGTGIAIPVLALIIGLATNAASAQQRWPGWLDLARAHPWVALGVLAVASIIITTLINLQQPRRKVFSTPERAANAEAHAQWRSPVTALPPDIATFTAREAESEALLRELSSNDSDHVRLFSIDGMPGVGKTSLAVHVAHSAIAHFPDGQLLVNLHTHMPGRSPLSSTQALAAMLAAVHIPSDEIPTGLDEESVAEARRLLWQQSTSGKRLLLVLDDARDHQQVKDLLPGEGVSAVLVTSRRRLVALGATPITLDALGRSDAVKLLRRLSAQPTARAATQSEHDVVDLCGRLPLAITLIAGRLRHHPAWTVQTVADRLRLARMRLSELKAGDLAVAAAFDLSFANLSPERQYALMLLGIHPGLVYDDHALAALLSTSTEEARELLESLYGDHLVEQVGDSRYGMHDLLREYSHDLASHLQQDDRGSALERLFSYYEETAIAASRLVQRRVRNQSEMGQNDAGEPTGVSTRSDAMRWLITERANLLACMDYQFEHRLFSRVIALSTALSSFLRQVGPWDEAISVQRRAIRAADSMEDTHAKGVVLLELGVVLRRLGDLERSRSVLEQALQLTGMDQASNEKADCLNELAVTHRARGYPLVALQLHDKALRMFRLTGDHLGQARSLGYIGVSKLELGRLDAARRLLELSMRMFREGGDGHGEASTSNQLGTLVRSSGNASGAMIFHEQALDIFLALGDRHGQANAQAELGLTLSELGETAQAIVAEQTALRTFEGYGNHWGQAQAHNNLGDVLERAGDRDSAMQHYEAALDLAQRVSSLPEAARAEYGISRCLLARGDVEAAALRLRNAEALRTVILSTGTLRGSGSALKGATSAPECYVSGAERLDGDGPLAGAGEPDGASKD